MKVKVGDYIYKLNFNFLNSDWIRQGIAFSYPSVNLNTSSHFLPYKKTALNSAIVQELYREN